MYGSPLLLEFFFIAQPVRPRDIGVQVRPARPVFHVDRRQP